MGRVNDVKEEEVELGVRGREVRGAGCAYREGHGRSSLEGDGGSIRKGVCTLVEVAFDVVEVRRDVSVGGGVGEDFDEA